jgi:hypothetical protein
MAVPVLRDGYNNGEFYVAMRFGMSYTAPFGTGWKYSDAKNLH